jgi:hypothetical protein
MTKWTPDQLMQTGDEDRLNIELKNMLGKETCDVV